MRTTKYCGNLTKGKFKIIYVPTGEVFMSWELASNHEQNIT